MGFVCWVLLFSSGSSCTTAYNNMVTFVTHRHPARGENPPADEIKTITTNYNKRAHTNYIKSIPRASSKEFKETTPLSLIDLLPQKTIL